MTYLTIVCVICLAVGAFLGWCMKPDAVPEVEVDVSDSMAGSAAYVRLSRSRVATTVELTDVLADLDKRGDVVGIEFLVVPSAVYDRAKAKREGK